MRTVKVLLTAALLSLLSGCIKTPEKAKNLTPLPGFKKTIVVVPYGSYTAFWQQFREGAKQTAQQVGMHIRWEKVPSTWSPAVQEDIVHRITKKRPVGIIVGPLHRNLMQQPIGAAAVMGLPVLAVASNEDTNKKLTYVGSDNAQMGRDLAKWATQLTPKKGRMAVVNVQEGMRSFDMRKHLFEANVAGSPLQVPFRYEGELNYTTANLRAIISRSLEKFLPAHPKLATLVTLDENSTHAAWQILKNVPLSQRPQLIGVSADPALAKAVRAGKIAALAVQNPYVMGQKSVETVINFEGGKMPGSTVNVPYKILHATLVTASS